MKEISHRQFLFLSYWKKILGKRKKHINRNFHVIILTLSSNYFSLFSELLFFFPSTTTISKETRENVSELCVCITLMIQECFLANRVGGKSQTYVSSANDSWLLFCFNHVNTFHSTSHARIHEWAISNVFHAFVWQIFLRELEKKEQWKSSFEAEIVFNAFYLLWTFLSKLLAENFKNSLASCLKSLKVRASDNRLQWWDFLTQSDSC